MTMNAIQIIWRFFFLFWNLITYTESFLGSFRLIRPQSSIPDVLFVSTSYDTEYIKQTFNDDNENDNEINTVKHLSEIALTNPGQPCCLKALKNLNQLCYQRKPFDFSNTKRKSPDGCMLDKLPQLIPIETTQNILQIVRTMQTKGWLSTNPDSVDGLPSFHLNLISSGKPVIDSVREEEEDANDDDTFDQYINQLIRLVSPYIYDQLLPWIHERMGTKDIQVSDIFLRRYGDEVIDGQSRHGISAHYDVFSRVTCVIAMDDTAKQGTNGLYTIPNTLHGEHLSAKGITTSNHRSLRRFFPLSCGDGVIHTWDVLHGVDIDPGIDRTSLIVWFSSGENKIEGNNDESTITPWLTNRNDLDTNHVAQFVLASALESNHEICSDSQNHDLYLQSATLGNVFAITRLGSLCESNELAENRVQQVKALLTLLESSNSRLKEQFLSQDGNCPISLAKRLWWQGAIRGNPLAQVALADELMVTVTGPECSKIEEHLVLASVLFALAAQQDNEHAIESLLRIQQLEASIRGVTHLRERQSLTTSSIAMSALATYPQY